MEVQLVWATDTCMQFETHGETLLRLGYWAEVVVVAVMEAELVVVMFKVGIETKVVEGIDEVDWPGPGGAVTGGGTSDGPLS